MKFLLGFLGFCLAIFVCAVVMQDLWRWFIVPFGVSEVGLAHAAGLNLLIGWRTHGRDHSPDEELSGQLIRIILAALLTWVFGCFFSRLM